jgi:hypothetical protein
VLAREFQANVLAMGLQPKGREHPPPDDPVNRQAMMCLIAPNRPFGSGTVEAIDGPGRIAGPREQPLQVADGWRAS